tara:strand:- start:8 stop:658 length:651 start_codon:yes stop_codon:yes gene_type:complete
MNFEKDNYIVIKKAIDPKIADFVYRYFLLKRSVARTLFDTKFISPFTEYWGVWNDAQVPETYSHYADTAMETLLLDVLPIMQEKTGLRLVPTYSYARIYKKGDVLKRHKDRFSCEISTTLNLGGDDWPIFIEAKENIGDPEDGFPSVTENKGTKVILEPGDMLVYKGNLCEHWREEFTGENCGQVFLHYNNLDTPGSEKNKNDGRPHLGLPAWFCK